LAFSAGSSSLGGQLRPQLCRVGAGDEPAAGDAARSLMMMKSEAFGPFRQRNLDYDHHNA
jgi:hypothetical protein